MERGISVGLGRWGLFFTLVGLGPLEKAWALAEAWMVVSPAVVAQQQAVPALPARLKNKQQQDKPQEDSEPSVDLFVPPPREVIKHLFAAQRLLEQNRLSEAVGFLQAILTSPEDYFFQPDPRSQTRRSLKTEAQRLLGQMPEEARQMYEIRYGPQARQLLTQAVEEGDPEKLSEISRTFYHTQAGYEATLLLGLHHLRSGRVLAAALVLDRLRQSCAHPERLEPTLSLALATAWYWAKDPQKAQGVLVELKSKQRGLSIPIGGEKVAWFGRPEDALAWLAQWAGNPPLSSPNPSDAEYLMVRNSPGRNASSSGTRPLLNLRWRVPVVDHPILEQWIQRLQQDLHDQGLPCLSQGIPLVVGDTVLMRSLETLVAVDLRTGKRLWESPVSPPWDSLLAGQEQPINLGQATLLQARLAQRLWLDGTYSRLSSDGKLVFCIEEDSLWQRPVLSGMPPMVIIRQRIKESRTAGGANRLVAYDIRTGKLQWELGGPEDQEYPLPLAGTTFLGPPLPLMGQLYVLGETGQDLRLFVFDAQTGRLLWSQQLGVASWEESPRRDFAGQLLPEGFLGLSPSYAEGIVVCPTGRGALIALDLASRRFLWAYAYLPQMEASQRRKLMVQRLMAFGSPVAPLPKQGWMETCCVLVDGRVVLTSPESQEIYCLSLADGKELWKQPCPDGLYVACVHEGKVIWVGRRQVGAFRLADGQPAWSPSELQRQPSAAPAQRLARSHPSEIARAPGVGWRSSAGDAAGASEGAIELPDGAVPSGLGFLSGDKYYLPLSTGEVATIDLTKGNIVHRSRSRTGAIPGNLICVRDKVISQGPSGVELYEQLEPLRSKIQARLAQNPSDPEALAVWGEILLEEGRRAEAIEAFAQSLSTRPDARTQQFLREALFEALEEDFVAYRGHLSQLEKLLDSPEDRTRYERLVAEGLLEAGEYAPAWQTALQLAQRTEQLGQLEMITKSHALRGDRWLQEYLSRLQHEAPAELRQQMDQQIQAQLEKAIQGPDPVGELTAFLNLYGSHPAAEQARQALLSRLLSGGRWLEAELLLRYQAQSADPAKQRAAIGQLADLFRRAGRPIEAAVYYRQLATQWANAICLEGKTGSQIVQSLPPDDPVRAQMEPIRWPQGRVKVEKTALSPGQLPAGRRVQIAPFPSHSRFFLSTENIADPIYQDIQIAFEQNRRRLLGFDRWGRELWKPFPLSLPNNRFLGFNRAWWEVYLQGHLLLVSTGSSLTAYDLLGISGGEAPRVLWSLDLLEANQLGNEEEEILLAAFPQMPWQQRAAPAGKASLCVVSDRVVCFQQKRYLTAVDTLTGQPLWQRSDLPPGCQLLADGQRLFVWPLDKAEILVLDPNNGNLLDTRSLGKLVALVGESAGATVPGQPFPGRGIPVPQAADVTRAAMPGRILQQYCLTGLGCRLLLWYQQGDKQTLRLYDLWEQKDVWGPMRFDPTTRLRLLEKEAVGLLEPNGQFQLVRIADGRVLIKDKLDIREIAHSLQGVHLMRLGQQYFVIPYGIPQGFQHMPQQQIPGMDCAQVPFGRVYAYSLEGNRLWTEPVELRQQNVLFSQPADLPVVVFATQLFQRRREGGGTFQVHVLAVHKQTGRTLLEETFPYTTNLFQITGNPENHTVDILLQRDKITLSFTDEPWPTETTSSPTASGAKEKPTTKKAPTLREGLWRSLQQLLLPAGHRSEPIPEDIEMHLPKVPVPEVPLPVPVPDTR